MNRVEVWRGPAIESLHRVHVAVVDGQGRLRASAGDPAHVAFARSAIKPLQALPLLLDGAAERFEMTDRELAVCCASHSGEPYHVECVRGLLARIGLGEDALACGPHPPFHAPSARALRDARIEPGRVHNNCSGKHAGMLALARTHDWPVPEYHTREHPVQQRMLREVCAWTGMRATDVPLGVDGCGVVTFALPVQALARAFGALARESARDGSAAQRVLSAMARYPEYVGGTGRLCTELCRVSGGRVVAKTGAEGVYCAAVPGEALGIALKVEDGATRAAEPALLAVLRSLGVIGPEELAALARFAEPELKNTRGEVVGRIRASIELQTH